MLSEKPKVTVLLITARSDRGYTDHPDWHTIGHIIECLNEQTFKEFEFITVDGFYAHRKEPKRGPVEPNFPFLHLKPTPNLWTKNKKACLSNYRNTGIAKASGELIINIDDCCTLPENYIETFWKAFHKYGVCLSTTWPEPCVHNGVSFDRRLYDTPNFDVFSARQAVQDRRLFISKVPSPLGQVFGFSSYPLSLALKLNGYDLAYDGAMFLEDIDWGHRLHKAGISTHLTFFPGFKLHRQEFLDNRVVKEPRISRCCNMAWQTERVLRNVLFANKKKLWPQEMEQYLVGPCKFLRNGKCKHHNFLADCLYLDNQLDEDGNSIALRADPLALQAVEQGLNYYEAPLFDQWKAYHG